MESTTIILLMLVSAATVSHVHSSQAPVKYGISNLSSYKDCTESCNKCACTETWPPEVSLCVCLDNIPPAEKCREKPEPVPYKECKQSCDSETACACTLVYPVELSSCVCLQPKQQQEQCQQRSDDSSSIIRYKQCVQSCETCACTLIYPKELSKCICLDYPAGAASQNSERVVVSGGNDKLQGNGDEKGLIPYPECIQSCESCACIRIWPPHLSLCVCLDDTNNSNHSLNKQALSE